MSTKPMIEEGRIKFAGLSNESFELPEIGDEVTYTVRGRCASHLEQDMANEGTRVSATIKLLRVVEGVSKKVNDDEDGQPSMFDEPVEDEGGDDDQDDSEGEDDPDAENEPVGFVGPSFSGGDDAA